MFTAIPNFNTLKDQVRKSKHNFNLKFLLISYQYINGCFSNTEQA